MSERDEIPSDMTAWEHRIPMARPNTNLQALMETAPDGHVDDSLQQADPIRTAIRRAVETMSEKDQFYVDALFIEQITIRAFAHRIGVEKSQAHRIKNKLAKRVAAAMLTEPIIKEYTEMTAPIMQPTTWQQAAAEALIIIERTAAFSPLLRSFDNCMAAMVDYVEGGHKAVSIVRVDDAILDIAMTAWLWLTEEARDEMLALIISRQRKYGTGNITKFGTRGIIVRMSDKIERLRNMGGDFADDSVVDAYMDLVGYGALHWMTVNGVFELPLADD